MARVVVCSTYELGAQPLGCAIPGAILAREGHDVRAVDCSLDELSTADIDWAQAICFSVPMHTALRLTFDALARVRARRPQLPIALHGLYATMAQQGAGLGARDLIASGAVDAALIAWLGAIEAGRTPSAGPAVSVTLSAPRSTTVVPLRAGLPALDRYAHLIGHGEERLVGTVETTTGCNHRCRHCPVPVIYNGRSRAVALDGILADIDQLIAVGASHIHFADPDFLNRPSHARAVVDALHDAHREITFDATIKVSHILRSPDLFADFAAKGLVFVISAFESTSDTVLLHLDKGHRSEDLARAIEILRANGIEPRPSLLPFTPWTTRDDLVELFDFVARHDLIWNVDPVQFSIRLLIPPGSLLLAHDDPVLQSGLGALDEHMIAYTWRSGDPLLDELALSFAKQSERAADDDEDAMTTYHALRKILFAALDRHDDGPPPSQPPLGPAPDRRARLSEAWFCCAEPTAQQRAGVR